MGSTAKCSSAAEASKSGRPFNLKTPPLLIFYPMSEPVVESAANFFGVNLTETGECAKPFCPSASQLSRESWSRVSLSRHNLPAANSFFYRLQLPVF